MEYLPMLFVVGVGAAVIIFLIARSGRLGREQQAKADAAQKELLAKIDELKEDVRSVVTKLGDGK